MILPLNQIIQGDVHDTLRTLPSGSFATGIADVPYGLGLKGVDWDEVPDYGPWINEAMRVLRPGGTLYTFGAPTILAKHFDQFPENSDLLIWFITNKTFPKLEWWQPAFDMIVATSKGRRRFFKDQVRQDYSAIYKKLLGKPRAASPGRFGVEESTYTDHGGTLPKNVLIGPALVGRYGSEEKVGHPTQKPLWLMERLILSTTLPGEPVLDLFSGSATSSVAAQRLGRPWLAIERDPLYCEMIKARIAKLNAASPDEKIRVDFDASSKGSFDTGSEAA